MTDYCGCGYKANMLCRVCKTTPTCNVVAKEHESIINVPMPHGYSFELRGRHTGANGVCPGCITGLAQREYQEIVRPVLGVEATSVFEMACIATRLSETMAASGWIHSQVFRSNRSGLLTWDTSGWRGPYLDGISVRDFAKGFATTALNRRRESGWMKVTPEKVDESLPNRTSFWSRSRLPEYKQMEVFRAEGDVSGLRPDMISPQLFVSVDGTALYCSDYAAQYAFPILPTQTMKLSKATAASLGIPVPNN